MDEEEAATAPSARYPAKLKKHLFELSHEKHDFLAVLLEWEYVRMEDTGPEADGVCPCGKVGLRYYCHIKNAFTHKYTFVGTACIRWFSSRVALVCKALKTLDKVTGQYRGADKFGRHMFKINSRTRLVVNAELLRKVFNSIPIWKCGKEWRLSVQAVPPPRIRLVDDDYYSMRLTGRISKPSARRKSLVVQFTPTIEEL